MSDKEEQAKKRLRDLIEEGLQSGAGRPVTTGMVAELRARTFGPRR